MCCDRRARCLARPAYENLLTSWVSRSPWDRRMADHSYIRLGDVAWRRPSRLQEDHKSPSMTRLICGSQRKVDSSSERSSTADGGECHISHRRLIFWALATGGVLLQGVRHPS